MKKSKILINITLAILALHLVPSQAAGSLDNWIWRNPIPTGNYLSGVANGVVNGTSLFVAVGYDSTILLSQHGVTWYQQSSPPNITLTGIAFGGNTFVAVGFDSSSGNPAILTSNNGSTWSPATGPLGSKGLLAVSYGGGMFVTVGYGGTILTSLDGSTWTPQSSGVGNTLSGVAYGIIDSVGGFVAVGSSGGIFTSTDGGVTWTSRISGTPYALYGVTYGNGTWSAVGQSVFLSSFNGTAWSIVRSGYFAVAVTYDPNDNLFVAWDNSEQPALFTSADALNWKIQGPATAGTTALFNALTYNSSDQTFVAVGSGGGIATSTSPYGTNWLTQNISSNSEPLNAVAYGNNSTYPGSVFVTGGGMLGGNSSAMLYSPDGITWSLGQLNPNILAGTVVYGITYGKDQSGTPFFVAAGTAYAGFAPNAEVLTSQDGVNWSLTYTNPPGVYINQLNAVTYGGGEFVAVASNGAILTSPDTVNWIPQTSGTTDGLNGVTYGGGLYVAVGSSGKIVTSPDGVTWTAATSGPNYALYGVAYGNGIYVAVGESSSYYPVIMSSSDGATWSVTYTGTTPYYYLTAVTYNNGTFLATGQNGQILASPDGGMNNGIVNNDWAPHFSGTGNQLSAVVFGESQFITVGASGTILSTGQLPPSSVPHLSPPAINPSSGTAQFAFTGGTPGSTVILQASTDLKNWFTKASATVDANGNASLSDTLAPNIPGLYYRTEQLP